MELQPYRKGKRTGAGAVKIAVDLVEAKMIDVKQVGPASSSPALFSFPDCLLAAYRRMPRH
jgi:hypothetical protein